MPLTRIQPTIADFEGTRWNRRSSLAAGFLLTDRNTVLLGNEGEYYMYTGTLPYAVPPNTNPTYETNWVNVGHGDTVARSVNLFTFMSPEQIESVRMRRGDMYVDREIQKAVDLAHDLKSGVYAESGLYKIKKGVKLHTFCRGIFSDGGAEFYSDVPLVFLTGTSDLDLDNRSYPLFRAMGGSVGWQVFVGVIFNGNCKNLDVAIWPDTSKPNQTHYGTVEIVTAAPYIFTPRGQDFDAAHGVSYKDHTKKESGASFLGCKLIDNPGTALVGNFQNLKLVGSEIITWYDHAIYGAGSVFADTSNGINTGEIAVTGCLVKNRNNNRGNSAIKARCGVYSYIVNCTNFDTLDPVLSVGSQQTATELLRNGLIVFSDCTVNTLDAFVWLEANDTVDNSYPTNVNPQIIIANCSVKADRFLTAGGSGGGSILRAANVLFDSCIVTCRIFASQYAELWYSKIKFVNVIATVTGGIVYGGNESATAIQGEVHFLGCDISNTSTTTRGYIHLVGANKWYLKDNKFSSIGFSLSGYVSSLVMDNNEFGWYDPIVDKTMLSMWGGAGTGLTYLSICNNKFEGNCGYFKIRYNSNCLAIINDNKFLVVQEKMFQWNTYGSVPKTLIFKRNYVTRTVFDSLNTSVSADANATFILADNTVVGTGTGDVALIYDNGSKAYLSCFKSILLHDNEAINANNLLYMINIAASYTGSNKIYNYNNAMIGSQFTCSYPTANKQNSCPTMNI